MKIKRTETRRYTVINERGTPQGDAHTNLREARAHRQRCKRKRRPFAKYRIRKLTTVVVVSTSYEDMV